jgi:periplasmic protein TonB
MVEALAARDRREPAFAGFQPAPPHPLRRQLARDGPEPLAIDGVADPGPGDRREPELGALLPPAPHPLRREPFYRRPRQRGRLRGPAGSLALHVLALVLMLIGWRAAPTPEPPPIPVQLVVEMPKPPPAPPAPPVHGLRASEDMGDTTAKPLGPKSIEAPPAPTPPAGPPVPPAPPLVAPQPVAAPPSPPLDLPQVAAALAAPPLPQPKPPPPPRPPARVASRPAALAERHAKTPGPAATRDEYLAYAFMLVRRHFYLLPRSQIGDRRGEAIIGFVVHDDGRISELQVDRSSGYGDIDQKAEEMIVAVGRFPPLPQWFQGEAIRLEFHLEFPTAQEW